MDFTGKTVALFGLGDQRGYGEWFVDGMGILGEQVIKAGGTIIGHWSTEGYEYDHSKAEFEEGTFYGLAIDEECQPDLTTDRLDTWTQELIPQFHAAMQHPELSVQADAKP
ncbi:MAG: flavodoxin domain-containing protein [Bacteroidota bacterium]